MLAAILGRVASSTSAAQRAGADAVLLTPREQDVLLLMGQGMDPHAIAASLGISLHTCRGYQKGIMGKLDAHSQLEAVVVATRRGLLPRRRVDELGRRRGISFPGEGFALLQIRADPAGERRRAAYGVRMTDPIRIAGAVLTEREHRVPLDHARPDGPSITVFTREVAAPDGARPPVPRVPPGRPGVRGRAAHEPALRLDEAGARASTASCSWTSAAPAGPPRSGRRSRVRPRRSRPRTWPTSGRTRSSATPSASAGSSAWTAGACWARASAASPR